MPTCRKCHVLVGKLAKQCFACGLDWNGDEEKILGSISWHRYGLEIDGLVHADFCETDEGERYIEYRSIGTRIDNPDFAIESQPILSSKIRDGRFANLDQILTLSNGDDFTFDNDGRWFTSKPVERIGVIHSTWDGSIDGLITREEAEKIATKYGRKLGLTAFEIQFSELCDRDGEPKWFVPLMFTDQESDWIGGPPCAFVHVDAKTGVPDHTPSL